MSWACRACHVFNILCCLCASRHSGVQFTDASTSKSGLGMVMFCTFLTWKCASGYSRMQFFSTSQIQKLVWDRHFFSILTWKCGWRLTSQLQKVVRDRHFFSLLTWKRALRNSGVQIFLTHLTRWLRTRRFSEPTFRPSWPKNHWKRTAFCDVPNISRTCIFLLTFAQFYLLSSDPTSLLCFSSSNSTSLLCFSTLHIVGSFTSKLPFIR